MDVVCWYHHHHRRHEVTKDHDSYHGILQAPLEGVL